MGKWLSKDKEVKKDEPRCPGFMDKSFMTRSVLMHLGKTKKSLRW